MLLASAFAAVSLRAESRVLVGTITDTMCGANHKMMGSTPAPECTRQCVMLMVTPVIFTWLREQEIRRERQDGEQSAPGR